MKNLKISKILIILFAIFALSLIFSSNKAEASTEIITFDSQFYANMNGDLKAVFGYDYNLLKQHWLNCGINEGRKASIVYDANYYLNNNADLKAAFGNNYRAAYEHFVNCGINEGRKASLIFDVQAYLNNNADLKAAFGNNYRAAYEHFVNCGINEGRNASIIFNVRYYLENNSDLKAAFGNNYRAAYEHFMNCGIKEGRNTSTEFNVRYYLENNGDLKAAFGNNYEAAYNHYLTFGMNEKRQCAPAVTTLSSSEISKNPTKYYGQTVNYTPANGDTTVGWKVFYADENNIYLIADDCIEAAKAPTKNGKSVVKSDQKTYHVELGGFTDENGNWSPVDAVSSQYSGISNINDTLKSKWLTWASSYPTENGFTKEKATAYLLDTEIWNASYGNSKSDYVIGTPTLEMFAASWNAKGYTKLNYATSSYGYRVSVEGVTASNNDYYSLTETEGVKDRLYYPNGAPEENEVKKCSGYWLTAPFNASYVSYASDFLGSAMATVLYNGNIGPYWATMSSAYGLRPVVCLKSGVQIEEYADGSYVIK